MKINNEIFAIQGNDWWADDAGFEFTSLRYCINPLRYGYFKNKLQQLHFPGRVMLDIGCGEAF